MRLKIDRKVCFDQGCSDICPDMTRTYGGATFRHFLPDMEADMSLVSDGVDKDADTPSLGASDRVRFVRFLGHPLCINIIKLPKKDEFSREKKFVHSFYSCEHLTLDNMRPCPSIWHLDSLECI